MFVIRPAQLTDVETLKQFAETTALGMISLPKDSTLLEKKIAFSLSCFEKKVQVPSDEIYCFVLENLDTGEVIGCCAIYAKTGVKEPICVYRLAASYPLSKTLPVPGQITILKPMKFSDGPAELSMLFLKKEWRKGRLGELLSLSRFLFIADQQHRVEPTICARLRGVIDQEKNTSPFWDGVGRHFIAIDFPRVCQLLQQDFTYIEEFLPQYPIYTHLLNKRVQGTIGRIHRTTRPALRMLQKEGLSISSDIDLFDGGPILQGNTSTIRSIKNSRRMRVSIGTAEAIDSPLYLISNCSLDYRCCVAPLAPPEADTVFITPDTAKALRVSSEDSVRIVRM